MAQNHTDHSVSRVYGPSNPEGGKARQGRTDLPRHWTGCQQTHGGMRLGNKRKRIRHGDGIRGTTRTSEKTAASNKVSSNKRKVCLGTIPLAFHVAPSATTGTASYSSNEGRRRPSITRIGWTAPRDGHPPTPSTIATPVLITGTTIRYSAEDNSSPATTANRRRDP